MEALIITPGFAYSRFLTSTLDTMSVSIFFISTLQSLEA